jgi:hypothetical protein
MDVSAVRAETLPQGLSVCNSSLDEAGIADFGLECKACSIEYMNLFASVHHENMLVA